MLGGMGLLGLHRLDRSLEAVVAVDMPRLATILDLRRQIRLLGVAETTHLLEADPARDRATASEIRSGMAAITELFSKYEPYLLPEDADNWKALRADVDGWLALDARVLALTDVHRTAEAIALSRTHSKGWEALLKALIATANGRLQATTARTRAVSRTVQLTLTILFIGSVLIGLVAGLYRRAAKAEAERLQRAERDHHRLLEQTVEGYLTFTQHVAGGDLTSSSGTRSAPAPPIPPSSWRIPSSPPAPTWGRSRWQPCARSSRRLRAASSWPRAATSSGRSRPCIRRSSWRSARCGRSSPLAARWWRRPRSAAGRGTPSN